MKGAVRPGDQPSRIAPIHPAPTGQDSAAIPPDSAGFGGQMVLHRKPQRRFRFLFTDPAIGFVSRVTPGLYWAMD